MSVTLLQIDSSFLFLDGIEPFFWPSVLHAALYKTISSIFDLGPLTPQIYSPKFGTKSHISRLVWQIDQRCLGLLRGFRGSPIQWNHRKCCGPTLVAMATKFGLKSPNSACPFKSILLFLFLDGIEPFFAFGSPCGALQNVFLRFLI